MRLTGSVFVALALLVGPTASAQKPEDVVRWNAKAPAGPVRPGATSAIELKAEIDAGWHMYALTQPEGGVPPLEIGLSKGQPFTLAKEGVTGPLPGVTKGTGGEPDTFHYDDKVTLTVPVAAPKTVKSGKHTLPIEVTYQVCSGSICLRPATVVVPVQLTVSQ